MFDFLRQMAMFVLILLIVNKIHFSLSRTISRKVVKVIYGTKRTIFLALSGCICLLWVSCICLHFDWLAPPQYPSNGRRISGRRLSTRVTPRLFGQVEQYSYIKALPEDFQELSSNSASLCVEAKAKKNLALLGNNTWITLSTYSWAQLQQLQRGQRQSPAVRGQKIFDEWNCHHKDLKPPAVLQVRIHALKKHSKTHTSFFQD